MGHSVLIRYMMSSKTLNNQTSLPNFWCIRYFTKVDTLELSCFKSSEVAILVHPEASYYITANPAILVHPEASYYITANPAILVHPEAS